MALPRIAAVCVVLAMAAPAAAQLHESHQRVRDLNGRWLTLETRVWESREISPSERVEEERIYWPNLSGHLVLNEHSITRSSTAEGRETVVIEIYAQNAEGFVRTDDHLALSRRVRISTTSRADGGRERIEEVEARNPVSPSEPLRITRRIVETVRSIGPDQWVTARRVFERDLNGRLVPVTWESDDTVER
jgi:hypothetical protein